VGAGAGARPAAGSRRPPPCATATPYVRGRVSSPARKRGGGRSQRRRAPPRRAPPTAGPDRPGPGRARSWARSGGQRGSPRAPDARARSPGRRAARRRRGRATGTGDWMWGGCPVRGRHDGRAVAHCARRAAVRAGHAGRGPPLPGQTGIVQGAHAVPRAACKQVADARRVQPQRSPGGSGQQRLATLRRATRTRRGTGGAVRVRQVGAPPGHGALQPVPARGAAEPRCKRREERRARGHGRGRGLRRGMGHRVHASQSATLTNEVVLVSRGLSGSGYSGVRRRAARAAWRTGGTTARPETCAGHADGVGAA